MKKFLLFLLERSLICRERTLSRDSFCSYKKYMIIAYPCRRRGVRRRLTGCRGRRAPPSSWSASSTSRRARRATSPTPTSPSSGSASSELQQQDARKDFKQDWHIKLIKNRLLAINFSVRNILPLICVFPSPHNLS